jgi:hypothetical protein
MLPQKTMRKLFDYIDEEIHLEYQNHDQIINEIKESLLIDNQHFDWIKTLSERSTKGPRKEEK